MIETMSLEEMKTYRGRQDVPSDFELFWRNELSSLPDKVDYQFKEKEFNVPNVQFYELTYKSSLNSLIYCKVVIPKSIEPVPIIFQFHGYQSQSADWSSFLNYIHAGYAIVSMDVRGQAGKSIDRGIYEGNTVKGHLVRGMQLGPTHLFYKEVYLDIFQLVKIIREQKFIDANNMYCYGFSQGGALALVASALVPEIKKTVAVYPFLSDFKRVLELGNHSEAYDELFRFFKFNDPTHKMEDKILNVLSYIDVKNFASKINSEIMLVTGLEDDVCPPSTQFAIYNRLITKKQHVILPEYGHENMDFLINDMIFDFLTSTTFLS